MKRKERGAYLVMMSLLIVVLIGVAALAIDVGRLLLLKTEMQNAADAAALAAAAELDTESNAVDRAKSAARNLLQHDGRFARAQELLGDTELPDAAFEFFCIIGSPTDVDVSTAISGGYCGGSASVSEPKKVIASSDADTHYVRVKLDPSLVGDGDSYTANLIFLPVLKVLGINVAETATVYAEALAGQNFFTCNYPPMAICDPWDTTTAEDPTYFENEMEPGYLMELRDQGGGGGAAWSPGNFGFLQPPNAGPGATDVAEFIANEGDVGCAPATFTTKTGQMTAKTRAGWNTRFGIYSGPNPFQSYDSDWPPAPNVIDYDYATYSVGSELPLAGVDTTEQRFYDGNWDFAQYWSDYHSGETPPVWSTSPPTRYEVYLWEVGEKDGSKHMPDDGSGTSPGEPADPAGDFTRRVMTVAVLSCNDLGITGGKTSGTVFPRDGFAKIFLTEKAVGPPDLKFYAEYIEWASESDGSYHVDIQLYE